MQSIDATDYILYAIFCLGDKKRAILSQSLIVRVADTEKHPELLRHLISGHAAPPSAYISFVPYFIHPLLVCTTWLLALGATRDCAATDDWLTYNRLCSPIVLSQVDTARIVALH